METKKYAHILIAKEDQLVINDARFSLARACQGNNTADMAYWSGILVGLTFWITSAELTGNAYGD